MTQAYSDPAREGDPYALPNVEVFYMSTKEIESYGKDSVWFHADDGNCYDDEGWYWWSCFPGCLPDGDASGPFDTEADALADAQNA